jgi:hypothetical protein
MIQHASGEVTQSNNYCTETPGDGPFLNPSGSLSLATDFQLDPDDVEAPAVIDAGFAYHASQPGPLPRLDYGPACRPVDGPGGDGVADFDVGGWELGADGTCLLPEPSGLLLHLAALGAIGLLARRSRAA